MKKELIKYRRLREIGISRERSREIIQKAYTFGGYLNLYPIIVGDYIKLTNQDGWTKENIRKRLEEIFLD